MVDYGASLVEFITIGTATRRTDAIGGFSQLYMDGSRDVVARLHELLCRVLTYPNLPAVVRMVCCLFLEHKTDLPVPESTWQILRKLFHDGSLMIKSSMLRIDRGNGAISDNAIYESLRSFTRNDLDA